jgi:antitoxin component of MazEF toxin-antitoxin module
MRTRLIKIGNQYGVRIPPSFLEEAGLGKSFHIIVRGDTIVLRRYKNPRYGWAKAFREAFRKQGPFKYTQEEIDWLSAPLGPVPDEIAEGSHRGRPSTRR